jgi:hypothetical protein
MELQGLKGIDQTYIRMPETYMDKLQGFKSKIFKDSVMEPGFIESLTAPEGSPINYDNISSMAGGRLRKAKEGLIDPVIDSVKNYAEVMNRGLHGEINRKNLSIKDQLSIITGMVDTAVGGMFSAPKKALGFDPNTLNMFVGPSAKDIVKAEGMAMRGASKKEIQDTLLMHKKPDGFWRKEISDSGLGQRLHGPANGIEEYTPMGSTYPHPELYDQYPNMKNINTTWNNQDSGGSYTKNGPMEYVNLPQNADWETQGKTTIHELQHAVQEKEGWARGGSPETFNQAKDAEWARDALMIRKEVSLNPNRSVDEIIQDYQDLGWSKERATKAKELATDFYNEDGDLQDLVNLYGLDKQTSPTKPFDLYQNLLGEREARDTASRMNLTLDERRGLMPDIGTGSTVKMGGGGPSMEIPKSENNMTLYHGSHGPISKIEKTHGQFDSFLFFSDKKSVADSHGQGGQRTTYSTNVPSDSIIDVGDLFNQKNSNKISYIADDLANDIGVDKGTAEDLISGATSVWDIDIPKSDFMPDTAELDWYVQKLSGEAANELGYKGVALKDEHGTSYMVNMLGKEKERTD